MLRAAHPKYHSHSALESAKDAAETDKDRQGPFERVLLLIV